MGESLSPDIEQRIAEALAGGLYPSREALLEAGVVQLLDDAVPLVPAEHMAQVEAALESIQKCGSAEMTRQDWDQLHRMVGDML